MLKITNKTELALTVYVANRDYLEIKDSDGTKQGENVNREKRKNEQIKKKCS